MPSCALTRGTTNDSDVAARLDDTLLSQAGRSESVAACSEPAIADCPIGREAAARLRACGGFVAHAVAARARHATVSDAPARQSIAKGCDVTVKRTGVTDLEGLLRRLREHAHRCESDPDDLRGIAKEALQGE